MEFLWFQRAKTKWMVDGDRNTKFYHSRDVQRRRRQIVNMFKDNEGTWIKDDQAINSLLNHHFHNLYTKELSSTSLINTNTRFPLIVINIYSQQDKNLKDEEIKQALFDMAAWKSLGPNTFPAGFYQDTWHLNGDNVDKYIQSLLNKETTLKDINNTDICLIPKMECPQVVHHFRPIALCNTIYKVFRKVIVNRLKQHMDNLVTPNQSSFIQKRSIHNNIIIYPGNSAQYAQVQEQSWLLPS